MIVMGVVREMFLGLDMFTSLMRSCLCILQRSGASNKCMIPLMHDDPLVIVDKRKLSWYGQTPTSPSVSNTI